MIGFGATKETLTRVENVVGMNWNGVDPKPATTSSDSKETSK
jgi:hypothetical protein